MQLSEHDQLRGYVHQLGSVWGWSVVQVPLASWLDALPLHWGKEPDESTAIVRMNAAFRQERGSPACSAGLTPEFYHRYLDHRLADLDKMLERHPSGAFREQILATRQQEQQAIAARCAAWEHTRRNLEWNTRKHEYHVQLCPTDQRQVLLAADYRQQLRRHLEGQDIAWYYQARRAGLV